VEDQDYEGLYKYESDQSKVAETYLEHAQKFNNVLTDKARAEYDPILGEDVVEGIVQEMRSRPGTDVYDLSARLAEERRRSEIASATAEARKSLPDLVAAEVQAKLVELGLAKRTDKVIKGETASRDVTAGKGKTSKEDMTYEQASDAYGQGDMSWPNFKPFKDEHDRKRAL
jgi:hypothetical protein